MYTDCNPTSTMASTSGGQLYPNTGIETPAAAAQKTQAAVKRSVVRKKMSMSSLLSESSLSSSASTVPSSGPLGALGSEKKRRSNAGRPSKRPRQYPAQVVPIKQRPPPNFLSSVLGAIEDAFPTPGGPVSMIPSITQSSKRVRRKASEIDRKFLCPRPGCGKRYGSDDSLNLHIRLKHKHENPPQFGVLDKKKRGRVEEGKPAASTAAATASTSVMADKSSKDKPVEMFTSPPLPPPPLPSASSTTALSMTGESARQSIAQKIILACEMTSVTGVSSSNAPGIKGGELPLCHSKHLV